MITDAVDNGICADVGTNAKKLNVSAAMAVVPMALPSAVRVIVPPVIGGQQHRGTVPVHRIRLYPAPEQEYERIDAPDCPEILGRVGGVSLRIDLGKQDVDK